ncbi:hypothetical protein F1559_002163 [Cyanidiococcus yangmingshanensis]|uniref:Uncharacterized protein n=1 Tax=Cyanidiococcus yangmingshanensis TaxID=2690220 RepID=A0A7J7IEP6_9RHOD|nr:hypothetical protein F1559_002163 [Cyanidiococcus yangmingshanensis]
MEKRSRRVTKRRFDGVHLPGSVWAPTEYSELKEEESTIKSSQSKGADDFSSSEKKFLEGLRESRGLWSAPEPSKGTPSLVSSPVKLSARKTPAQRFMTLQDSMTERKELDELSASANESLSAEQGAAATTSRVPPANLSESPIKSEVRGRTSPTGNKTSPKDRSNVQIPKARRWSLRNALSLRTPPATPTSPISAATSEGANGATSMKTAPPVQTAEIDGSASTKEMVLPKVRPAPTVSLPDKVVKNNFQSFDAVECMSIPSVSPAAQSDASAFSVGDILASSNDSARWEEEPFEKVPPGEAKMRPRRRSALAKMLVCFR